MSDLLALNLPKLGDEISELIVDAQEEVKIEQRLTAIERRSVLDLRATTSQKCELVPSRVRIQSS